VDWKDVLKESGISIAGILGLIYVCGWQFHLSFLHELQADVHFFIPLENAIGAGVQPFFTVFLCPGVAVSLLAWVQRSCTQRAPRRLALWVVSVVAIAFGACLPLAIILSTRGWRQILPSGWDSTLLGFGGATLGITIFNVVRRYGAIGKPNRYYAYALIFLLFLGNSVYYALISGKQAAQTVTTRSGRAQLTFSDPELRKQFGASWFVPVLETREDILLLRFAGLQDTNGRLLLIKRAQVQAIEYSSKSAQPVK